MVNKQYAISWRQINQYMVNKQYTISWRQINQYVVNKQYAISWRQRGDQSVCGQQTICHQLKTGVRSISMTWVCGQQTICHQLKTEGRSISMWPANNMLSAEDRGEINQYGVSKQYAISWRQRGDQSVCGQQTICHQLTIKGRSINLWSANNCQILHGHSLNVFTSLYNLFNHLRYFWQLSHMQSSIYFQPTIVT